SEGARRSLQARTLHEARAIGRMDAQADRPAVAHDLDRDFDPRRTAGPDLVVEIAEALDLRSADAGENVAAADAGGGGRSILGDTGDDDLIAVFSRKDAEPRARRLVDAAIGQKIVEDRGQKIDRHDHVDVARAGAGAQLLDMERADANQPAVAVDRAGAAPERMGGGGEQRLVEEIFPIAGELLLADNHRPNGLGSRARGDRQRIAELRFARSAEFERRAIEIAQRLDEAEAA